MHFDDGKSLWVFWKALDGNALGGKSHLLGRLPWRGLQADADPVPVPAGVPGRPDLTLCILKLYMMREVRRKNAPVPLYALYHLTVICAPLRLVAGQYRSMMGMERTGTSI